MYFRDICIKSYIKFEIGPQIDVSTMQLLADAISNISLYVKDVKYGMNQVTTEVK
jgi:hypothetical protein